MVYIFCLILLIVAELFYFKIASYYNIIDKPNHRSSHSEITIRGGGIIFPLAVLIWFVYGQFQYPFFVIGLMLISTVSFIDDVRHFSKRWRLGAHLLAILLVFLQLNLLSFNWFIIATMIVFFIGVINAYNFMDGINGITGIYSLVTLLSFLWINIYQVNFIDTPFLLAVIIATAVFNFFNSRNKAKCFAGDVGSISMAFIICFLLLKLILQTTDATYILLLALYGVDTIFTIILRLIKKQNIFLPHRLHLYQLLVNERGYKHLTIALCYGFVQILINLAVIASVICCRYLSIASIALLIVSYIAVRLKIARHQLY